MGQDNQARLASLSTASMLSAIGVTVMYGLSVLIALLAPDSPAIWVVSLVGLILWLVGMYNTAAAFDGVNDNVSDRFTGIFKAQLSMVIAAVAYVVVMLLIPKLFGYGGAKAAIIIIKLLTIGIFAYSIMCIIKSNNECRALKAAGLNSMVHVSVAFVIQLVLLSIFALISFIVLFSAKTVASFLFNGGIGTAAVLLILIGLASLVGAVFMIIGWWGVRSELPKMLKEDNAGTDL